MSTAVSATNPRTTEKSIHRHIQSDVFAHSHYCITAVAAFGEATLHQRYRRVEPQQIHADGNQRDIPE